MRHSYRIRIDMKPHVFGPGTRISIILMMLVVDHRSSTSNLFKLQSLTAFVHAGANLALLDHPRLSDSGTLRTGSMLPTTVLCLTRVTTISASWLVLSIRIIE